MTLEELRNKKITVTVNKTISLEEDLSLDLLRDVLEDQEEYNYTDEELLENIINTYYGCSSDLENILDFDEYKITIS